MSIAALLGALAIGGCTAKTTMGNSTTRTAAQGAATTSSSTLAGTTTTPWQVGHVGQSWTITDDSGDNVTVGLVAVIDPAHGASEFATPDAGHRFMAVKIVVTNNAPGTFSDDLDTDVTMIGSDGKTYTATLDPVAGCTNFNAGLVALPGDASVTGCVAFELPTVVKAAQVDFLPSADHGGSPAVWDL
ncbi:MAG: hypothetical protein ABR925_02065 [Acidimicrobiales bacterium]|jgi:hypothetical protein